MEFIPGTLYKVRCSPGDLLKNIVLIKVDLGKGCFNIDQITLASDIIMFLGCYDMSTIITKQISKGHVFCDEKFQTFMFYQNYRLYDLTEII